MRQIGPGLRGLLREDDLLAHWRRATSWRAQFGGDAGRVAAYDRQTDHDWCARRALARQPPLDSPANQSSKADSGRRAPPRRQRSRPSRRFRLGRRFAPAHVSRGLARCHHLRLTFPHPGRPSPRMADIPQAGDRNAGRCGSVSGRTRHKTSSTPWDCCIPQENPTVRRRRPDATDLERCRRSPRCHGYFPIVAAAAVRPVLLVSPRRRRQPPTRQC